MRLGCVALACQLALAAALRQAAAGGAPASFDYLHVEANEGSASGGHVAIRFAELTFHFQHHDGGFLRLHRDDSTAFVHTYARLQNRPIHVQSVAVSAETHALLRRRFNDRFLLEERQFAILAALQRDRDLLASLREAAAPAAVQVRGAGFFADPDARTTGAALVLTPRAETHLEDDLVASRRHEVDAALARLAPARDLPPAPLGPHAYAAAPASFAQRAAELLEAAAALEVLQNGMALRAETIRTAALAELQLTPEERGALGSFAARLEQQSAALLRSSRPDWGSALLLALARRAVLAESVASGTLAVLDAYPDDAVRLPPATVRAHADILPALLEDARADLAAARRALRSGRPLREAEYNALEAAANRFLELHEARTSGSELRLATGPLLPSRRAARELPAGVLGGADDRRAHLVAAEARAADYGARLRALYGYDLLARNCVSEIFREIAAALTEEEAPPGSVACAGSQARLGGCIDPAARLRFIPFVSARAVAEEYPVAQRTEVASHRDAALAAMYARENDLGVFLRESNVLTSTIYRRHEEDSPFLFFTADAVLARPLFGVVNLAAGLGASVAGLFVLPADDGELLRKGLRGALFSVPELAFVSLRKGSFAYVPRAGVAATRKR